MEWVEHLARDFEKRGNNALPIELTIDRDHPLGHGGCLFNPLIDSLSVEAVVLRHLPNGAGYCVEVHLCCPKCGGKAANPLVFDPIEGFIR